MDAVVSCQVVLQQGVDGAVALGHHLGIKGLGRDEEPEVGFLGGASLHWFMVSVQVGIVVNLEAGGIQARRDLYEIMNLGHILLGGALFSIFSLFFPLCVIFLSAVPIRSAEAGGGSFSFPPCSSS